MSVVHGGYMHAEGPNGAEYKDPSCPSCLKEDVATLRAAAKMAAEALELFESAAWDRLYAEGPLSRKYAQHVAKDVKSALAALRDAGVNP